MEYLVRKKNKSRYKKHVWIGNDTACRMWSTGGLVKKKYHVVDDDHLPNENCSMCIDNLVYADEKKAKAKKKRKERKVAKKWSQWDFYKSDAWRELRYKALKLYGRQCMCCGAKPPNTVLHVDHIKPRSRFPDLALDIDNLQILCEDCNLGKSNNDCVDYRG